MSSPVDKASKHIKQISAAFLLAAAIVPSTVHGETPAENVAIETLDAFPHYQGSFSGLYTDFRSLARFTAQLVTREGHIFATYISPAREQTVVHIDPGGEVQTNIINGVGFIGGLVEDDAHNHGSIALDEEGYIHIATNMHGHIRPGRGMTYYISDEPMSIDNFTYVGGHPFAFTKSVVGNGDLGNSYPNFQASPDGRIYFTYRSFSVRNDFTIPGALQGNLGYYDIGEKTYVNLGGDPYPEDDYDTRAIIWTDWGRGESSNPSFYQNYRGGGPFFGADKRMHMAWTQYGRTSLPSSYGSSRASELIYATTLDGGETFLGADGSLYTDPPFGEFYGDVALLFDPGYLGTSCHVSSGTNGQPVVMVYHAYNNRLVRWNGNNWEGPLEVPGNNQLHGFRLTADPRGVLTYFVGATMYRSYDNGSTWSATSVGDVAGFDQKRYRETGELITYGMENQSFTIKRITIEPVVDALIPFALRWKYEGLNTPTFEVLNQLPEVESVLYTTDGTAPYPSGMTVDGPVSISSDAAMVRAQAINGSGNPVGLEGTLSMNSRLPEYSLKPLGIVELARNGNWAYTNIGYVYRFNPIWYYFEGIGWFYIPAQSHNPGILYSPTEGWIYFSVAGHPHFWSFTQAEWSSFQPTADR